MIAAVVTCATRYALLRATIAVADNNLLLCPNPRHRLRWHHLILQLVREELLPPAEQDLALINRITSAIGLYTYGSQLADMSSRPGDEACALGVQQQPRDVQPHVARDVCACAAQGIDPVCSGRYCPISSCNLTHRSYFDDAVAGAGCRRVGEDVRLCCW